jgi:hypothetical protein
MHSSVSAMPGNNAVNDFSETLSELLLQCSECVHVIQMGPFQVCFVLRA